MAERHAPPMVRLDAPVVNRQFEIEFLDPSVEAFSFTFG
jgi:hypothetical protein